MGWFSNLFAGRKAEKEVSRPVVVKRETETMQEEAVEPVALQEEPEQAVYAKAAAEQEADHEKDKASKGQKKAEKALRRQCFDNRELSWLKFNARVLEEAEDPSNPFCERLTFASIFQSNLDEFFMVRVGSLYDQMLASKEIKDSKTGMTCKEQLLAVFDQVRMLTQRKDAAYWNLIVGLKDQGVEIASFAQLDELSVQYLDKYFAANILPLLSPQIIDKNQPFPFLKHKAIYAVAVLGKKENGKEKLGLVPCNLDVFPRLLKLPGQKKSYVLLEDVILHYIDHVFDKYELRSKSLIRIIRNADIDPDDEAFEDDPDFRHVMEQLVHQRKKLCPIKLEYTRLMEPKVIDSLCQYLDLKKKHVFHSEAPLDLSFFSDVRDILRNRKDLSFDKFTAQQPKDIDPNRSVMEQVEEKDRFLFFPYDKIDPFLRMLNEAAVDPSVLSIKMTLYRVANDSKVVEALIKAAENGKEVGVLVELRARFDEENNIEWSRRLEDAGCRVIYGIEKLKCHSKLCLITRMKNDKLSYITQIGTGNYNEKTARLYTDFSLITAHQGIGAEANEVFRKLYLGQVVDHTEYLMVSPKCLKNKVIDKIDAEIQKVKAGQPGYVGAKMNSLTDKAIIEKLMEASRAGVKVELIIRGACCLIAGVPYYSENISVRSIVGRYLEHSRIYLFGQDQVYIASADYMTRNTTRRVEVATPIYDPEIKARIKEIFRVLMADNTKARIQMADGQYIRVAAGKEKICAQEYFMDPAHR